MPTNTAVNFLPIFSDEKKVEVSVVEDQAVIRLSTWTEGLGWCAQKTMALDGAMLEDLHRAIAAARIRIKRQTAENGAETENAPSRVLEFPRAA